MWPRLWMRTSCSSWLSLRCSSTVRFSSARTGQWVRRCRMRGSVSKSASVQAGVGAGGGGGGLGCGRPFGGGGESGRGRVFELLDGSVEDGARGAHDLAESSERLRQGLAGAVEQGGAAAGAAVDAQRQLDEVAQSLAL